MPYTLYLMCTVRIYLDSLSVFMEDVNSDYSFVEIWVDRLHSLVVLETHNTYVHACNIRMYLYIHVCIVHNIIYMHIHH